MKIHELFEATSHDKSAELKALVAQYKPFLLALENAHGFGKFDDLEKPFKVTINNPHHDHMGKPLDLATIYDGDDDELRDKLKRRTKPPSREKLIKILYDLLKAIETDKRWKFAGFVGSKRGMYPKRAADLLRIENSDSPDIVLDGSYELGSHISLVFDNTDNDFALPTK